MLPMNQSKSSVSISSNNNPVDSQLPTSESESQVSLRGGFQANLRSPLLTSRQFNITKSESTEHERTLVIDECNIHESLDSSKKIKMSPSNNEDDDMNCNNSQDNNQDADIEVDIISNIPRVVANQTSGLNTVVIHKNNNLLKHVTTKAHNNSLNQQPSSINSTPFGSSPITSKNSSTISLINSNNILNNNNTLSRSVNAINTIGKHNLNNSQQIIINNPDNHMQMTENPREMSTENIIQIANQLLNGSGVKSSDASNTVSALASAQAAQNVAQSSLEESIQRQLAQRQVAHQQAAQAAQQAHQVQQAANLAQAHAHVHAQQQAQQVLAAQQQQANLNLQQAVAATKKQLSLDTLANRQNLNLTNSSVNQINLLSGKNPSIGQHSGQRLDNLTSLPTLGQLTQNSQNLIPGIRSQHSAAASLLQINTSLNPGALNGLGSASGRSTGHLSGQTGPTSNVSSGGLNLNINGGHHLNGLPTLGNLHSGNSSTNLNLNSQLGSLNSPNLNNLTGLSGQIASLHSSNGTNNGHSNLSSLGLNLASLTGNNGMNLNTTSASLISNQGLPNLSGQHFSNTLTSNLPPAITHPVARASPATIRWLLRNFEPANGISLPRAVMYQHYCLHAKENGLETVNAASFGKLVRSVFVGLRTRRLGTRGHSKYHYYGIRMKPDSNLHEKVLPGFSPTISGNNLDSSGCTYGQRQNTNLTNNPIDVVTTIDPNSALLHSAQKAENDRQNSILNHQGPSDTNAAITAAVNAAVNSVNISPDDIISSGNGGNGQTVTVNAELLSKLSGNGDSSVALNNLLKSDLGLMMAGQQNIGIKNKSHDLPNMLGGILHGSSSSQSQNRSNQSSNKNSATNSSIPMITSNNQINDNMGILANNSSPDNNITTSKDNTTSPEDGMVDINTVPNSLGNKMEVQIKVEEQPRNQQIATLVDLANIATAVCQEKPTNLTNQHLQNILKREEETASNQSSNTALNATNFIKENIPECLDSAELDHKFRLYAHEFVECIVNLRFNDLSDTMLTFYTCHEQISMNPKLSTWLHDAESNLYQTVIQILFPSVITPIPATMNDTLRSFSKNIVEIMRGCLKNIGGIRQDMMDAVLDRIQRFSRTIKRITLLNHLSLSIYTILKNTDENQRMVILHDLNKISMEKVCDDCWLKDQQTVSDINKVWAEMKSVMLVNSQANKIVSDWQEIIVRCYDRYKNRKSFIITWNYIASTLVRDLTLRSVTSFGSILVLRLFLDELVQYIVLKHEAEINEIPICMVDLD